MAKNKKVYVAFLAVVMAMAFLILWGFNEQTMVYYSTVKELKDRGTEAYGRGFRVSGKVVPGTVERATDRVHASFVIVEEGETLRVEFDGILPDTFKEDGEVLIEGTMREDGTFQATNVFTKCASKYEPMEEDGSEGAKPTNAY